MCGKDTFLHDQEAVEDVGRVSSPIRPPNSQNFRDTPYVNFGPGPPIPSPPPLACNINTAKALATLLRRLGCTLFCGTVCSFAFAVLWCFLLFDIYFLEDWFIFPRVTVHHLNIPAQLSYYPPAKQAQLSLAVVLRPLSHLQDPSTSNSPTRLHSKSVGTQMPLPRSYPGAPR